MFLTGMPKEAGPQTVSGCLPPEAGTEDHQIPTHAQGNYFTSINTNLYCQPDDSVYCWDMTIEAAC